MSLSAPPPRQDHLKSLRALATPFRARDAEAVGVARWRLRDLRKQGAVLELARGVYALADAEPTADIDFLAVAQLAPKATVCLISALAYWDLTDEIPAVIDIAVPRHSHRPRISYPPTKVHEFDADTFTLDRKRISSGGGEFWVYGPARSVVDAVRLPWIVGSDQAYGAMRRYLERPDRDLPRLLELATALNVRSRIVHALQILL